MFLNRFVKSAKCEMAALSRNILKISVFGCLFVATAMIILYAGSSPLWMRNLRIFRGGAFCVFLCYLSSVIFFFLCGGILCTMLICKKAHLSSSVSVIIDIVIAYVFRMLWIILFFGGFSPLFALVSILASLVFLIFAFICSIKFSSVTSLLLTVMIIFTVVFIFLTLKFIIIT